MRLGKGLDEGKEVCSFLLSVTDFHVSGPFASSMDFWLQQKILKKFKCCSDIYRGYVSCFFKNNIYYNINF